MALSVPKPPGFASMLKDGARHLSGLDEAVYQNIEACSELAKTTRSAFGPSGLNKMVINHLSKLFVTNDAATMVKELEIQHPAAKLLVMASQQQEAEAGDGTNVVLMFAGVLLDMAQDLLRSGLSITEVVEGYELALDKCLLCLDELSVGTVADLHDKSQVVRALRPVVMSKQWGYEDFLANLITDACVPVLSEKGYFNVDNVRVVKIVGCGLTSSYVVNGMVFKREVESDVTSAEKCKIAVYACPLEMMQTETKGTVLIHTAEELKNYNIGEEQSIEDMVKSIHDRGVNVIVSGGKIGDMMLHFCNKYSIMVVRLNSKFDVRRLCKTVQATALPSIVAPTREEIGYCNKVFIDEIGESPVIIFEQEKCDISTIVVRGATENVMDDIERSIDDAVNTYKALTKDARLIAGAGATEIELATKLSSFAETCAGLEQYAIQKFAEALEAIPRALAENTGVKAAELVSKLYAAHQSGDKTAGFDLESGEANIFNSVEAGIVDLLTCRYWALKYATVAACTVLRVDQIIMAKPAGGPKPKENKNWDED